MRNCLLIFFCIVSSTYPQTFSPCEPKSRSCANSAVFLITAEKFARTGNYFEAITEYKRFIHLQRNTRAIIFPSMNVAELYFRSKNLIKSRDYFQNSLEYLQAPVTEKQKKLKLYVELKLLDVKNLEGVDIWGDIRKITSEENSGMSVHDREMLRYNTSLWLASRGARHSAERLSKTEYTSDEVIKLNEKFISTLQNPPQIMSNYNLIWAAFPGGLYFRIQEHGKGFLSLFTVSSLSAVAVLSFQGGYTVSGIIFSVLSFRFFLDSVAVSFSMLKDKNEYHIRQYEKSFHSDSLFSGYFKFSYPFKEN